MPAKAFVHVSLGLFFLLKESGVLLQPVSG